MSYCRFGEGDVYMYPGGEQIHCCMCILVDPHGPERGPDEHDPAFSTRSGALEHLREHERAGHRVPPRAIERLEREIRDVGEDTKLSPWEKNDAQH